MVPLAKDPLSEAVRFGQKVPKGELKKFIKLNGGKLPPTKAKQSSYVDVAIDAGLSNGKTIEQVHDVFQAILEDLSISYKF